MQVAGPLYRRQVRDKASVRPSGCYLIGQDTEINRAGAKLRSKALRGSGHLAVFKPHGELIRKKRLSLHV
jgi:hypothetical protein